MTTHNKKGIYQFISEGVRVGAFTKTFVVSFSEGRQFIFTECDTLADAIKIKGHLTREGHKVSIEVYPRWD